MDFVQSLERGLAVIRSFDAEHPDLTLSEVAARTGRTLTAVYGRRIVLGMPDGRAGRKVPRRGQQA